MGNWDDKLLQEMESIASEAENRPAVASFDAMNELQDDPLKSQDIVYRSTSNGVAVCRMLFDSRGVPEDFLLESVNPAFGQMFGVDPERIAGRKGNKFFAGGKKIPALDFFHRVLREKETVAFMFFAEKFGRVFDILAFSLKNNLFCMVFTDATAHVAAEREHRESEHFTWKVFESVDVWITLLDEQGRIAFWNATAERLSGISVEEALSGCFDFRNIFCPEEPGGGKIAAEMDACRRGELPEARIETCVCGAGGTSLRVDWTVRPWHFEEVDAEGLLLMGRDVTEMHGVKEKLEESLHRYAAAFRETRVPMFIVDPDTGGIFDCNDAALAFYGYTREEMLGLKNSAFNTQPPEKLREKMENARTGRENRFVFTHRTKNGEIRAVEVYSSPMPYHGKTYIHSIVRDITEKQLLEEQLDSLSFDCALQAKILRSILENSSDYLYVFDHEGTFRFVGKKSAALFRRTPDEMAGLSWRQLGIPDERTAPLSKHLEQVFSTGKTRNGMIILPVAGGEKPLEYTLNATCRDDGSVETVFCSMRTVP